MELIEMMENVPKDVFIVKVNDQTSKESASIEVVHKKKLTPTW
jgi:hypothetical protein